MGKWVRLGWSLWLVPMVNGHCSHTDQTTQKISRFSPFRHFFFFWATHLWPQAVYFDYYWEKKSRRTKLKITDQSNTRARLFFNSILFSKLRDADYYHSHIECKISWSTSKTGCNFESIPARSRYSLQSCWAQLVSPPWNRPCFHSALRYFIRNFRFCWGEMTFP